MEANRSTMPLSTNRRSRIECRRCEPPGDSDRIPPRARRSASTPQRSRRNTRRRTRTSTATAASGARSSARSTRFPTAIVGPRPAVRDRAPHRHPARARLSRHRRRQLAAMVAARASSLWAAAPLRRSRSRSRTRSKTSYRRPARSTPSSATGSSTTSSRRRRAARRSRSSSASRKGAIVVSFFNLNSLGAWSRRIRYALQGQEDHRPRRDPAGDAARGLRSRRPPARARDPRAPAALAAVLRRGDPARE